MPLFRAIATVGGFTLLSRLTGFVRDVLIAALLGAGPVADCFFVAFKLPNFFRRLTGEGAFSVAFVPLFAGLAETDGREAARRFADEVFAVILAALAAFTLAVELTLPWLMLGLAPGFADAPEKFALAVELTRITFPYLPLISLVALLGGMLNSFDRFAAMASAPILLNLILVGAMAGFAGMLPTDGHLLAWGVALAGAAQLLWLLDACRRAGLTPRLRWPRWTPRVAEMFRIMLPAAFGAGVVQLNLVIDVILASLLPTGAVSFLYYADRVNQLPLGVVGAAIGTALLPALSRQIRAGHHAEALATQNRALEIGLLLTVPAAAGIAVLAHPIVALLFERGAFSADDTARTAAALIAFSFGLPAFVLVKVFQPGFFARRDTRTPVRLSIYAVGLNLVLNLILMQFLAHVGLALATTIASWVNVGLLAWTLQRRDFFALDARMRRRGPRIILAALLMTAAVGGAAHLLDDHLTAGSGHGLAVLAALIALAMAVYFGACTALGAASPADLKHALARPKPRA